MRFLLSFFLFFFLFPVISFSSEYTSLNDMEKELIEIENQIKIQELKLEQNNINLSEQIIDLYKNDLINKDFLILSSVNFSDFILYVKYNSTYNNYLNKNIEEINDTIKELDSLRDYQKDKIEEFKSNNHFPVLGNSFFIDSWHFPRGGGTRKHKGTDIMALHGTPVISFTSGTIEKKYGENAGLYLILHADNGWKYYYMHLQSVSIETGYVNAGEIIGTVGSSGNASYNSPHLHFETHIPNGGAVNPYPYLVDIYRN